MNIQQLRAQIAVLQDATMDENKNFRSSYDEGKFDALTAVDTLLDSLQEEPVSTKDKLLALSDGRLHLGWIDYAKVVEFEECLMQFHEDMNNIPQGTDSLTRLKDTDEVLHSYSKKLMSMAKEEPVSEGLEIAAHRCYRPNETFMDGFKKGAKWQKRKDSIVTEELEEASKEWLRPQLDKSYANYGEAKMMELTHFDGYAMLDAIEFGAKWKEEQFEKNRLAACDKQTEEEAEREQDFVMGIIECEHRKPTFDDAIKYGMRLHKEQIMANTADAMIGLPYENKDGGYTHLIDVSRPLPVGNNKIAIIFKED